MRITGGIARGIPLLAPKSDWVRPATDAMRQAVFSSLGSRVGGARFLDLFAGSGAYGLEALSRGATEGVWVEKNGKAADCIRRNLVAVCKSVGCETSVGSVLVGDAIAAPLPPWGADLVFVDPPYDLVEIVAGAIFSKLGAAFGGRQDPVVIFEMPGEIDLHPVGWTCVKRLGKGVRQPTAAFFRRSEALAG